MARIGLISIQVVLAFVGAWSCLARAGDSSGKAASGVQSTWPQWRGPNRDGRIADPAAWPDSLSGAKLVQSWRVPLGPSYSGPIVSESLVFTTETSDKKREVVRALDRKTGEQRWEAWWDGALSVPFFAKSNGDWIRSTPTYDGESLFVAGMNDVLVCLDAQSGVKRWQVDFVKQLGSPIPAFGFVCSPLVDGSHVYVQAGAAFCKLDKRTGKILWRALQDDGGMMGTCIELATGKSRWTTTPFGKYWSLVANGDRVLALDERGELLLIRANPEQFEKLDTRKISDDPTWAHLAACGGEIFIRELNAMAAYRWRDVASPRAKAR